MFWYLIDDLSLPLLPPMLQNTRLIKETENKEDIIIEEEE